MSGYWTSFLPDTARGGPPQGQNLVTVFLRDPSPPVSDISKSIMHMPVGL